MYALGHISSGGEESACNAGDPGLILGSGRSLREGKGYPLQYSGLQDSMDCIVGGVAKGWTQLNDFHDLVHFFSLKNLFFFLTHSVSTYSLVGIVINLLHSVACFIPMFMNMFALFADTVRIYSDAIVTFIVIFLVSRIN